MNMIPQVQNMVVLQLSSGQGPVESERAVAHARAKLEKEAADLKIEVVDLECEAGSGPGAYKSVIVGLLGETAQDLAAAWSGSMLWVCPSADRPTARRKNWYFSGAVWAQPGPIAESAIIFEPTRSSGPGGQHVNRTQSAVRATHTASGLTIKVQSERSQHANKKIAASWIAHQLARRVQLGRQALKSEQRMQHHQLERGNPKRVFEGVKFQDRHNAINVNEMQTMPAITPKP